jgi:hypothetical protein
MRVSPARAVVCSGLIQALLQQVTFIDRKLAIDLQDLRSFRDLSGIDKRNGPWNCGNQLAGHFAGVDDLGAG